MNANLHSHTILTYDDVVLASPGNGDETIVPVDRYDGTIISRYIKRDMVPLTGETVYVRETVARMLAEVSASLAPNGLRLRVVYGYRSPEVQNAYFTRRRNELALDNPGMPKEELDRMTHNFVAVPDVAGHPTGGAVDLTITDADDRPVPMGTKIADYTDPDLICTFDRRVSADVAANRRLLHDHMVKAGFAPFYGEWWHFSYGDREWAAFYGKKKALYGAISISEK